MATLVKQHGRYYLQFYDKHRSPKRKRVTLGTTRKRTATKLQRKLEDGYALGKFDPWRDDPKTFGEKDAEPWTVEEALKEFLDAKRQQGRSENTVRSYRHLVGLFTRRVGEERLLRSIAPGDVEAFVHDQNVSKGTRHARFRHVRAWLNWCEAKGQIQRNPMAAVEAPDKPEKLPKAITWGELQAICSALREDYEAKRKAGKCREGDLIWMIPLFEFAFLTGLRASELARLRWEDIDRKKGLIYVWEQKNGKQQTVPLHTKAREVLDKMSSSSTGYVFCSPRLEKSERSARRFSEHVGRTFARYREEAELPDAITFHSLRHSFCTMLAEAGKSAVVIKEAARHADVATSMRYVHIANRRLREEINGAFSNGIGMKRSLGK